MADTQELEEIIVIEDNEAEAEAELKKEEKAKEEIAKKKKKKLIIFGAIGIGVLLLIIIIVLIFVFKSSNEAVDISTDNINEKLDEKKIVHIEPSKLENMIAKANYLYTTGSKEDALLIYEKIAIYSEAISMYNLGVAQLKNKQYKLSLSTFKKAIQNDENRCVSAINAAVCALHLKDQNSFNYYIDLAYAYLPNEADSPLYSYYYALINYYKNNYLEALSALKNPMPQEYKKIQKHLNSKINAFFGNNYNAIESMEKEYEVKDAFSLGLLYARVGDLTLATQYFESAITQNTNPIKAPLALALINLKAGRISSASTQIKKITDQYPKEVYKNYPINVKLKDSLFNPDKAQYRYRNIINESEFIIFEKIFYFAPYKIFNANKTISYIRKGNANIYIENVVSAKPYLKKGIKTSNINSGITKAIKKALAFNLRDANDELLQLTKTKAKHSILNYNLALTYAQMGDIQNANKYFLKSYHIDAKNYLSGVFAVMTSKLLNLKYDKLKSILQDSISQEPENEETNLYNTLLYFNDNNLMSSIEWLDKSHANKPLDLALNTLIALKLNKKNIAKKSAQKLTLLLPNEILPQLMYIDSSFNDLDTKEYANKVLNYLKLQKFHLKDLAYGPYITRYLYTQENLIIGKLYYLRSKLKTILSTTTNNPQEIMSALALASLYDNDFEESYTIYNELIDKYKVRDARTLFLGAVASTAASHHANAIALLELSKMKDPAFLETRFALGLLYMEINNNNGAVLQLGRIPNSGFNSEFFNFDIDLDKLYFEKTKKIHKDKISQS